MKRFLIAILVIIAAQFLGAQQQQRRVLNLDDNGTAIQGYDPVAFFTDGKPVLGKPEFFSVFNGARYRFASTEHKQMFDKEPAKYEPQFGGYCAYGVSKSALYPIKIEAWQIVNGRLLMQYDLSAKAKFNEDAQGRLKKADDNWPGLVEKYGK
jgi:YHS domain-containing protein